jgi:hypothetical protein
VPIGILFWVLMILWFVFGLYWEGPSIREGRYGVLGGNVLLFVLLGLLGWRLFGPVLL